MYAKTRTMNMASPDCYTFNLKLRQGEQMSAGLESAFVNSLFYMYGACEEVKSEDSKRLVVHEMLKR